MSTKYIASNWRLPNQENSSKSDNYGLTFDGSELIDVNYTPPSDWFNNGFSISAWVYPTSPNNDTIIGAYSGGRFYWRLYDTNKWWVGFGSWNDATTVNSVTSDEWQHIVLTYTPSDTTIRFYRNGISDGSIVRNLAGSSMPNSAYPLNIGVTNQSSNSGYFNGSISQCCLYDYTLTESQISTLYGSSSLGAGNPMTLKPQPVAYYPLGDNSASNPLTQPNEAVEDASVFDFDESNDFIDLGTTTDYDTGDLSASIWVNASSSRTLTGYAFSNSGSTSIAGFDIKVKTNEQVNVSRITRTTSCETGWLSIGFVEDAWQHLAFTYNESSNTIKLFLNGVLKNTTTGTAQTNIASKKLTIGSYKGSLNFWKGQLSNAQIWNTTLLDTEIETLYNSGVPLTGTQPQASNLKAWYKLDQSANWEADSSGAWQIPDAVSAYPQSFDFNGLRGADGHPKQEIIAPNVPQGQNFTFSCWANFNNPTANLYHPLITVYNGSTSIIQMVKTRSGAANANQVYFTIRNTSNNQVLVYSNIVPTANEWCHIAGTYDGSNVTIYFNGVAGQSLAQTGDTIASGPIEIGSWYYWNTTYGANFDGQISNVQYFDTAFPATGSNSIQTLYNNGVPLTTAIASDNLKLWAKLDNNEKFDGTNWSVENQKYPAGFDSALSFDGSSNYVDCGNDSTLQITGNLTVSVWFKLLNNSTNEVIVARDNGSGDRNWSLRVANTGQVYGLIRKSDDSGWGGDVLSPSAYDDGNWHHAAMIYTPSTSLVLYVDGAAVATDTTDIASAINNDAAGLTIGGYFQPGFTGEKFNGKLSNVAIYNTALEASAISTLYNNGTPETSISSSPVSWWKLDNTTTGIQDSTGSNDGTNNGATKVNTFVSTEAATSSGMTEQNLVNNNVSVLNGESSGMTSANLVLSDLTRAVPYDNYSFDLDGTDFINCGNFTGVNNSPTASWCGWFKPSGTTGGTLFSQWSATTSDQSILFSLSTSLTRIDIYLNTNIAFRASGGSALMVQDEWNFVCLTFNKDNTAADRLQLYINNSRVTETTGFVGPNANINNSTADFLIAGYYTTTQEFLGNISNFTIFNEELTSTEMLKLYANGVPQDLTNFTPQPVAWYPLGSNSFWNGSAWTVRDMIGSNDGTGQNIGVDGLVGDSPRSSANGTGTNMDIPTNLEGSTKWSENNSWSINMSSTARVEDTP